MSESSPPIPPTPPAPSESGKFLTTDDWESLKAAGFSEAELSADQPFGPLIFSYTRQQAIEDGVLVDLCVPPLHRVLRDAHIVPHCAMTATCFAATLSSIPEHDDSDTPPGVLVARMIHLTNAFAEAVRKAPRNADEAHFSVPGIKDEPVEMYAKIGPGDKGEMVLTFMLEGED